MKKAPTSRARHPDNPVHNWVGMHVAVGPLPVAPTVIRARPTISCRVLTAPVVGGPPRRRPNIKGERG